MYKVHQGPSKFNVHNRRVLTQQLDQDTSRDGRPESAGGVNGMSLHTSPKPVFHSASPSGKWQGNNSRFHNEIEVPADQFPPEHLEKVRMLSEAWNRTKAEIQEGKQQRRVDAMSPITVEYLDKREHPLFQNFEPMDLEKEQLDYMMSNKDTT
ncbi:MAPK regulated corepressor interacting protein 2-like [Patiria miniata]|uniref:Uncharacterized protein n=1 Tax=Patiria miniata TaxID=46514 RepID=A0A914AYL1_PATMI|nr:MAPK regulated corepressor interacting protein 2-like [Patiria miniata]